MATVLLVVATRGNNEPSPRAHGYREVGMVQGVHFWVKQDAATFSVWTTGAMGGICNQGTGLENDPYRPAVCDSAVDNVGTVLAYLTDDSVRDLDVTAANGHASSMNGRLSLDGFDDGKQLLIVVSHDPSLIFGAVPHFS